MNDPATSAATAYDALTLRVLATVDQWDDVTVAYLRAGTKCVADQEPGRWAHTSLNVTVSSTEWRDRIKYALIHGVANGLHD